MKSSFGGCGVGGEDVYIGPKQPNHIVIFLTFWKLWKWIHATGNDHQLRRVKGEGHISSSLQQGVEQENKILSTRPLYMFPQFGTFSIE